MDLTEAKYSWAKIDWEKAERQVRKLQSRIAKAVEKSKWNLVKKIQYLLTKSKYAISLAVKKVSTNKGKNTPGVDNELMKTTEKKEEIIKELTEEKYKSSPLKRVMIPKKNGKKRALGIPTMKDRVMQAVHHMGLDPIAEVKSDRTSFGFKKNRSCQDAGQYLFNTLARKTSATEILECDIRGCFDNISHNWTIENIPMNKKVLKEFLKSGYIYNGEVYKTEAGTPQGGIISPTLANLTLDGIEKMLQKKYWSNKKGTIDRQHNKKKVYLTRYADDFVITAVDKETLEEIKKDLIVFLKERGLELSEEKTRIISIHEGFDFLGWNFKKYKGKLLIQPSEKSQEGIARKVKTIIKQMRNKPQEELIKRLNPIITGWCNYHKSMCSKKSYQTLDSVIYESLNRWSYRRHQSKSRHWRKEKYWKKEGTRNWIFDSGKKRLKKASDVRIVRHTLIKLEANPYLPEDREYYEKREQQKLAKYIKSKLGMK